MDQDIQNLFGPASQHRLTVTEKEQIYVSLCKHLPAIAPHYQGSFLWRALTGVFSSWAPIAAVIIVLTLTGAGLTVAQGALPGDPLYPLKRMTETLRATWSFSTESKLETEHIRMDRRLDEAGQLEAKGKLTENVSAQLDEDYRRERREATDNIKMLEAQGKRDFAAQARARLNAAEDRYEKLFKGKRREGKSSSARSYPSIQKSSAVISSSVSPARQAAIDASAIVDDGTKVNDTMPLPQKPPKRISR